MFNAEPLNKLECHLVAQVYFLCLSVTVPILGRLSDIFGEHGFFIIGSVVSLKRLLTR
jgi:MFS family permease